MTIRTVRRRLPVKPSAGVECPTELGAQSSAHNHSIKCASPITLRACPTGKSRRPKIGGHTGKSQTDMIIHRLSERPDLIDRVHDVDPNWPEFMRADPVMNALFGQVAGAFPHLCAVATDASGTVAATGRAVAFTLDLPGRGALPDGGLDRAMVWAFSDRLTGRTPDIASAVEIAVGQEHRGSGLSHRMLAALRDAVRDAGLTRLVAPVRPNGKHRYPALPMAKYITMVREDGLPDDPWLRVHVRTGGKIRQVAAASMVMAGPLAHWRGKDAPHLCIAP